MAHYALIDSNDLVVKVIVGKDEDELGIDWEAHYGEFHGLECKRTSYNTIANEHLNGGTPFRKNYASPGFTYDRNLDAFIPPKPFSDWVLDEETCQWVAPIS